jgi:hypothetical protein
MSRIGFSYVERHLRHMFDVAEADRARFLGRIKQLQRLGFPEGVNIGRGEKLDYTLRHLFQMAVAFELINSGITAKPATRIVSENWGKFERGIGFVARCATRPGGVTDLLVARVVFNGLVDSDAGAAVVTIEDRESLSSVLETHGHSSIDLNLSSLVRAMIVEKGTETETAVTVFSLIQAASWFRTPPAQDELNWFRAKVPGNAGLE